MWRQIHLRNQSFNINQWFTAHPLVLVCLLCNCRLSLFWWSSWSVSGAHVCTAIVWMKTQTQARTTRGSPQEIMSVLSQHTWCPGEKVYTRHPGAETPTLKAALFSLWMSSVFKLYINTCKPASRRVEETKECKSESVKIQIAAQTVDRVLLEWREAGWITQRSAPLDSSATLWPTLAGRCARITWQQAGLQQTSIFFGCSGQKPRDHLWCAKAQVLSSSSVLWKAHLSEVWLPQSVCCPKQNTGRARRGNPQQQLRRETASRMKLQFYHRPLQKCPLCDPRRRFGKKMNCSIPPCRRWWGNKAVRSSTDSKHKKKQQQMTALMEWS